MACRIAHGTRADQRLYLRWRWRNQRPESSVQSATNRWRCKRTRASMKRVKLSTRTATGGRFCKTTVRLRALLLDYKKGDAASKPSKRSTSHRRKVSLPLPFWRAWSGRKPFDPKEEWSIAKAHGCRLFKIADFACRGSRSWRAYLASHCAETRRESPPTVTERSHIRLNGDPWIRRLRRPCATVALVLQRPWRCPKSPWPRLWLDPPRPDWLVFRRRQLLQPFALPFQPSAQPCQKPDFLFTAILLSRRECGLLCVRDSSSSGGK